jgi:hypothetical protein
MPLVDYPTDPGAEWPSQDHLENVVRYCLVKNPGIFTNSLDQPIPQMVATIPGQYDENNHGIDVIAIDAHDREPFDEETEEPPKRRLWLIEVSGGSRIRNKKGVPLPYSVLTKELPDREFAGYNPQMSKRWRLEAAEKFLKRPESTEKLERLFDVSGYSPEEVRDRFRKYYESHKMAVIVPAGTIVVPAETKASRIHYSKPGQKLRRQIETDIKVGLDIYTFNWNERSRRIFDVEENFG